MANENRSRYYDLDQIKQIPILDVCNAFGVEIHNKSGKSWCKVRPERTPSVILHPDRNTYHDFGTNETSDNIGLVSAYLGVDRGEAIRFIGEAFNLVPVNPREGVQAGELTAWEYQKIGLSYMASNNFEFDLFRQGQARVIELQLRYSMPMNVLKKNHPLIYERLLKQRAIPYVRDLRKDYYLEVFSQYNLAREIGSPQTFHRLVEQGEFEDMIKELYAAEKTLERACKGTSIKAWEPMQHDPVKDIEKILSGEIRYTMGNKNKWQMEALAKQAVTSIKYQDVDFGAFMSKYTLLDKFNHSTFFKDGKLIVAYLEKDRERIRPILDQMRAKSDKGLDQKIANARQRQARKSEQEQTETKNLTFHDLNREER